MIRLMTLVVLGIWGFMVAGCINSSRYHGAYSANNYMKNAQTIPPIVVPHGMASPVADQLYPIPWAAKGVAAPKISLIPPDPNYQHYLWEKKQVGNKKKSKTQQVTAP